MKRFLTPKVIIGAIVVIALMVLSKMFVPVPLPHIQLPAETVFVIGGFKVTNTMITLLTADLLLIYLALRVGRGMSLVPGRLQGFFELIIEYWKDMADQLVGEELGRKMLPIVLTMFFLVVTSNWLELVPGVDSVGWVCESGTCPGEELAAAEGLPALEHTYYTGFRGPGDIFLITARDESKGHGDDHGEEADHGEEVDESHDDEAMFGFFTRVAHAAGGEDGAAEDGKGESKVLVPFYRVTASDLNFTLALALIAFFVIEWAGFRELGFGYLKKFFAFDFSHGVGQGLLNMFVGLLEGVSEVARIVSFSFRLFGNLFAGQILLFVMPFLVPLFLVLPFFGLETFVGMIQGFVFAMLTLVFASVAIEPHGH